MNSVAKSLAKSGAEIQKLQPAQAQVHPAIPEEQPGLVYLIKRVFAVFAIPIISFILTDNEIL